MADRGDHDAAIVAITIGRYTHLTTRAIKRGVHRSISELERSIREFVDQHNEDPKPFIWTKTADQIIAAVQRHCQTLLDLREAE